jgi:hypothetical protein
VAKRIVWISVGLLAVSAVLLYRSCSSYQKLTSREVEEWIDKNVSAGSTVDEVISFLDTSTVNSFRAEHHGLIPLEDNASAPNQASSERASDYIGAVFRNVNSNVTQLQVYRIHIYFYFRSDGRLRDYKIETLGDW